MSVSKSYFLEEFYFFKQKILAKSNNFFLQNSRNFFEINSIKIGCEIEFYLFDQATKKPAESLLIDQFLKEISAKKEQGESQFEVELNFSSDLKKVCSDLENIKNRINSTALDNKLFADFSGQPLPDDCGSSLQFNISLHDKKDENIFLQNNNLIKICSASLLDFTDFMMVFLAPNSDDYLRFSKEININLFNKGKYSSPINLSFGGNNRTCAIRTIGNQKNKNSKRLEYRVASASADVWLCISAILVALGFGLSNQKNLRNYEQIYGNAFDAIYNDKIPEFSKNFSEAKNRFESKENFIRKKFIDFLSE